MVLPVAGIVVASGSIRVLDTLPAVVLCKLAGSQCNRTAACVKDRLISMYLAPDIIGDASYRRCVFLIGSWFERCLSEIGEVEWK